MKRFLMMATAALVCSQAATAQNLLANPSFEDGFNGWTNFNNSFIEPIFAVDGTNTMKAFGTFGGFSFSGAFQDFPAASGDVFSGSVFVGHLSSDPLEPWTPDPSVANAAIMSIQFFDAGNNQLLNNEFRILDSSSPTDIMFFEQRTSDPAPAGTAYVRYVLGVLQGDNSAGDFPAGAAYFDAATFVPTPGALGLFGVAGLAMARRRR